MRLRKAILFRQRCKVRKELSSMSITLILIKTFLVNSKCHFFRISNWKVTKCNRKTVQRYSSIYKFNQIVFQKCHAIRQKWKTVNLKRTRNHSKILLKIVSTVSYRKTIYKWQCWTIAIIYHPFCSIGHCLSTCEFDSLHKRAYQSFYIKWRFIQIFLRKYIKFHMIHRSN